MALMRLNSRAHHLDITPSVTAYEFEDLPIVR
jgi:hypothetical protein